MHQQTKTRVKNLRVKPLIHRCRSSKYTICLYLTVLYSW